MLQNCSIWGVASVFFKEPTKQHYLMEISRKAGIAHTSVMNHLKTLKQLAIITETVEEKGKRSFPIYKAAINTNAYKAYKKLYNIASVTESGIVNFLKDSLMPRCIVLFGSYQKAEDIEDSDIDIFVECKKKSIDLTEYSKKLDRNIQLHFKDSFKQYPKELKNNIANGTVLSGFLEAF